MRRVFLSVLALLFFLLQSKAQKKDETFNGAKPGSQSYKALFVLNEGEEGKMKGIIRNINNALKDPRFKGKLQVELVAFSDGVALFKKENNYDSLLLDLKQKGVLLVQCENTLRERKIDKDKLWPFISFTPSGVGEIIIRQQQGWSAVHP